MDEPDKSDLEPIVIKQTPEEFSARVEEYYWMQDVPYYEAITALMEEGELEPAHVAKLLTPALKTKLSLELEDVNLIKKSGRRKLFE